MSKLARILLAITIIYPIFFISPVYAVDINVSIDLTYSVNSLGVMHIKEVRTVTNSSSRFYIPSGSKETFIISTFKTRSATQAQDLERVSETITLTDLGGRNLNPTISIQDDKINTEVTFGTDLYQNQRKTFVLEYDNFELAEKNGNIWNVYVPGFPADYNKATTSDNGATTQTSYGINLELDKALGTPNFVLPTPTDTYEITEKYNYIFDPSTLVDQSVWIQIGNKQYYSFTITQPIESSSDLGSKVFNTWYDLLLPRESDMGNQKVYFQSITPEPQYVRVDEEGNVVARFSFESGNEEPIEIRGFITSNITEEISESDVGDIDYIDLTKFYATLDGENYTFANLLSAQKYWEVEAPAIQEKATELKQEKINVFEILLADYNFVTDSVDYDNLKTGIDNQRQGALYTLNGGSSVCMEYSDLLITLLRAQGIPARASFGYGFDPKSESATEEGHQWVEVYMPNVGWVAVDPTWGDTGRKNYIGGDVDHALWYVAGTNVETPSPVTKYSFSDIGAVESPKFEIQAHESLALEQFMTLEELLDKYEYTQQHKIYELWERMNIYGRIVFVGIPTFLLILLLFTLLSSIIKIIKKYTARNVVLAKPAGHDTPNNPYY
jgi:transglutaminase-like putative cysteine protease